jgi:uracil-DNA glycosylase
MLQRGVHVAQFPFGAPVLACGTEMPTRQFPVLVLGAYPSALHVRWVPPEGYGRAVAALPVDNEPTPFWDGQQPSAQDQFQRWHDAWFRPGWGTVAPAPLNGSSGAELVERWLTPLGCSEADVFITDCLSTARTSTGVAARLADRYHPFADAHGAPRATLAPHPSERDIVIEALGEHSHRLTAQMEAADPDLVVTLGNAAARVLAGLGGQADRTAVLRPDTYGQERQLTLGGRTLRWQALVHPATPRVWADRHNQWLGAR